MPRRVSIALDFGGTKLAAGLVDLETGEVYREVRERTPAAGGRAASLETALAMVRRMIGGLDLRAGDRLDEALGEGLGERPGEGYEIAGIGVSFGGHVDAARGVVERSMHVPGWEGFPLADYLSEAFSLPAFVDNDANAVALGLKHYGPGRSFRQFMYITVSTGIGGALVVGDDVLRGRHNLAGEIGHMVVQPGGPVCSCGNRGCLEALASGPAIARAAQKLWDAHHAGDAAQSEPRFLRAEDVFAAAGDGDRLAKEVIEEAARFLGRGISYAVNLLDPECVMIGGGVSRGSDEWFRIVGEEIRANVLPAVARDLKVMRVQEDVRAALAGAGALVRSRLGHPSSGTGLPREISP